MEFRKTYIASVFFIGFFIASIIFLIIPLIKEIEKNSRDLIIVKADRKFFSEERSNIEKFENIFKEIQPNIEKTNIFFVSSEVPIDFINFLEKLASDSDIFLKIYPSGVSLVEKSNKSLWPFLNFNLEASGSFYNFSKFIEKLENSSYLIQVQDLNIRKVKTEISSSSDEGLSNEISASFFLKVFAK
ncbi:MAG: hypothetical protein NTU58_03070 [Candidatus Nealsonbacteria bacterium]|nr:hypothetical protein [Candidatus Nealsonbacteria bacterium]